MAHPWPVQGSWLTLLTVWAQPTEVSPERRLLLWMMNNTDILVSQDSESRQSKIEIFNQHGNSYLAEGVVLTWGVQFEHVTITMY